MKKEHVFQKTISVIVKIYCYFLDLTGYILRVTEVVQSKTTSNEYFDVYFKTSPSEHQTIRVMKKHNRSINRIFFLNQKEIPVKMTNLTKGDGVSFYRVSQKKLPRV